MPIIPVRHTMNTHTYINTCMGIYTHDVHVCVYVCARFTHHGTSLYRFQKQWREVILKLPRKWVAVERILWASGNLVTLENWA